MTAMPRLTTDRLVLRPHVPGDFAALSAVLGSDRARFMGGPYGLRAAWGVFCHDVACWALFGHGALAVETRAGRAVGQVGISAGPLFPERELGWLAYPDAEGQGFLAEAAAALRAWFRESFGAARLVSYVDPANARSIALARRLGCRLDPDAPAQDPGDLVFLHPAPPKEAA